MPPRPAKKRKAAHAPPAASALHGLLGPDHAAFFDRHWEQRPLVVRAAQRPALPAPADLFSRDALYALAAAAPLHTGLDLNVCKYAGGQRSDVVREEPLGADELRALFGESGYTFQVLQPQKHVDALWRLCAELEDRLGVLVGCNAYLTPAGAQGLAPHHDDIEVFAVQCEGSKIWRLYEPHQPLPDSYSRDLPPSTIGKPILEVELHPGDVLYFPRGTIHQARTTDAAPSVHVTISTYQKHTWREFLQHAAHTALDTLFDQQLAYRRGLPVGMLRFMGTHPLRPSDGDPRAFAAALEPLVRGLADEMLRGPTVAQAADCVTSDFVANRLPPPPPPGRDSAAPAKTQPPGPGAKVRLAHPGWMRARFVDDDEMVVELSIGNSRRGHMLGRSADDESSGMQTSDDDGGGGGDGEDEDDDDDDDEEEEEEDDEDEDEFPHVAAPRAMAPVLAALLAAHPRFVAVSSLAGDAKAIGVFLTQLYVQDALEVQG